MAHFDFAANEKKGARAYNQAIDIFRTVEVLKKQPEGFKRFGHIGESSGGGAAIWKFLKSSNLAHVVYT